jgi:hypothetical protein
VKDNHSSRWYARNRDKRLIQMRAYYHTHRAESLAYSRDYKRQYRSEFRLMKALGVNMKEARVLAAMNVSLDSARKLLDQGFEV